ncbi:MAG TPA: dynamin family protein [Vicinamibacteria bacterium]|nr:dynamin family protein [Vicinamibacteria bacterium]
MKILTGKQQALLAAERGLLGELAAVLARLDVDAEDQETFQRSLRQLDELFLLVVVGEFNAGKSAFINALLGQRVLEEGVTPTTSRIALLKYGEAVRREATEGGLDVIEARVDMLREINIVDTPGTNAVLRAHEALTREFVPRSDLVLFITSADRPFTESERAFLQSIREWGKKVIVVVNKVDILEREDDVRQVVAFVSENFRALLGVSPEVFPVSARLALRAKTGADGPEALARSRFEPLEAYVAETLDQEERVRLKLLNPLGVGLHLLDKHLERTEARLELLRADFETIESIDRQLALYQEDLARDFRFRLADVEKVLLEFERRGMEFFDEMLRLGRVFDLVSQAKLKRAFERAVVADLPQKVEQRVEEVIDWMVASDLRQWQGVMEHLERRKEHHSDRLVGRVMGVFEHDRARLLESVRRHAQRALESYDRDKESSRLAESVQVAVAGTAALQVGALGLGTIVTMLAGTTMADMTGILAAGALSVLGLLILPARRARAKSELRGKVEDMRGKLMSALTGQFDEELEKSLQRIREAVSPYTRFVRSEKERLFEVREDLRRLRGGLERVRVEAGSA